MDDRKSTKRLWTHSWPTPPGLEAKLGPDRKIVGRPVSGSDGIDHTFLELCYLIDPHADIARARKVFKIPLRVQMPRFDDAPSTETENILLAVEADLFPGDEGIQPRQCQVQKAPGI